MRKIKDNKNGITLVALVVTIVVLLILAGISLSLILGNNGIVKKVTDAKTNYSVAQGDEQNSLNNAIDWMDQKLGGGSNLSVGYITLNRNNKAIFANRMYSSG